MGFVLIRHSAVDHRRVFYGSRFTGLVCEGETVGQAREVDEMGERTCACGQWQVRQRMRHDMWMTIILRTQKCAILILSHACSRDEVWLCCATLYVLYLWVYCSHSPWVGWRFFSRQPKPVPTLRKITIHQAWRLLRIPLARLPLGLVPRRRRWRSCLQVGPRSWRRWLQVSPRLSVEPPNCFRVNGVVVLFVAFKLLPFSLSYLLTARNNSVFLLGSCQVLVMQSSLFAGAKSGRWLSGSWVPPSEFAVRVQLFAIWILSALVAL